MRAKGFGFRVQGQAFKIFALRFGALLLLWIGDLVFCYIHSPRVQISAGVPKLWAVALDHTWVTILPEMPVLMVMMRMIT